MKKIYTVDFCCISTLGKVRGNNEDNFYCNGEYRKDPQSIKDDIITGQITSDNNELMAVFDGMGGEACGEIASFVAASNCSAFCLDRQQYEEYLYELCDILNTNINDETKARSLVLMGTTAAMVQFGQKQIYVLNAGDSRIYKITKRKINQISQDHTAFGYSGKAPLTKFLGYPDNTKPLSPYIARGDYNVGDMYLLCTDGVTDMLSDNEIVRCISEKDSTEDCVKKLIDKVLENGAVDNTTAILCRISKCKVHR